MGAVEGKPTLLTLEKPLSWYNVRATGGTRIHSLSHHVTSTSGMADMQRASMECFTGTGFADHPIDP